MCHNHITISHKKSLKYVLIALCLTLAFMFVEASAAYISGSMTLWADSSHLLVHNSSLLIALTSSIISFSLSKKNQTKAIKVDIFGGLINCLIFIGLSFVLLSEGLELSRTHEHYVDSHIVTWVALLGFFTHCAAVFILYKGKNHSFNIYALFLHTFVDCFSTVITFVIGLVITYTNFNQLDIFASMFIACLIAFSGINLLKNCVKKLKSLNQASKIEKVISGKLKKAYPIILNIHNSEVILTEELPIYAAHIIMAQPTEDFKQELETFLKETFNTQANVILFEKSTS